MEEIDDILIQLEDQLHGELGNLVTKARKLLAAKTSPPSMPDDDAIYKEQQKLPYTKHLDDGQFNDGQQSGFEIGAKWMRSKCEKDVEFSKYVKTALNLGGDTMAIVSDLLRKRSEIFNQQEI